MRKMKRLASLFLILCAVLCMAQPAAYATDYFLVHYPDPHFNLSNEPNRVATVEEFATYVTTRAYWAEGSTATPATDKNGKAPSAWCAKYLQKEIEKGTINPKKVSYSDPATVYFAAEFLSRCKGQYHYDYEYEYSFSNTSGLTAEQQMYLNVAAECKLIPYTPGMDAKKQITRAEMGNYLPKEIAAHPAAPASSTDGGMKELHVYFVWEYDANEQLRLLKQYSNAITLVSFHAAYVSDADLPLKDGNLFYKEHFNSTNAWEIDRVNAINEAIAYCNENGITPLLSISNFGKGGFDSPTIERMLSTEANQDACIKEIIEAIQRNNFKGVNIGFESVKASCRDAYISFITKLNAELDKHGWVFMNTVGSCFAADMGSAENGSFYDYGKIGDISDYVHIIMYDAYPDTAYMKGAISGPGPMSNTVNIDRVMKYATHRMPSGKILMGLSSFAIDYHVNERIAADVARHEVLKYATAGITETTDVSDGGHFEYTLDGKPHTVYLETDAGMQRRLYKMFRYNLCGASVFYLGSDFPSLYKDAATMSPNRLEVMNAAKEGIIPVNRRNLYKNAISRAEFCDLIVSMIEAKTDDTIDNFMAKKNVSVKQGQFSDTNSKNVLCAAALGIVNGRDNVTFAPNNPIKRQEAAAMLSRLADCMGYSGAASKMEFNDTKSLASWAQEGIAKVSSITDPTNNKRVMNGTGSGKFSPLGTYTREQGYMTIVRLFHAL